LRFADYFGLLEKGSQHQLLTRSGLTLALRGCTSDMPIADEMFVTRTYDRALDLIGPDSNVIDIGAQSGMFSVAAASRGARVFCCEPFRPNLPQIKRNAELNGVADRITVSEVAVAGKPGEAELLYREHDTGGSTLYQAVHREWDGDPSVQKAKVDVVTLADVFTSARIDRCDCLKLDCEGAEYDILLSNPPELGRIGAIILEYHPNGDVRDLRKALEAAGFSVWLADDSCTLFARRAEGAITAAR